MVSAIRLLKDARLTLEGAGIEDAAFEARTLFKLATGKDALLLQREQAINDAEADKLAMLCAKRAQHYPLQYLCGEWGFMGLTLKIGEGVLIPRADSEILCMAAIEKCEEFHTPQVTDLCSGSGAIALGIKAAVPCARVTAVELSAAALYYLKENAKNNIQVVNADVLTWQEKTMPHSIDILTANPPYIACNEMQGLAKELSFEPRMALCDEGDGLLFYRHIISAYKGAIAENGYIMLEIGCAQADAVQELLRQSGYINIEIRKDYGGNNRVALAKQGK